MPFSASEVESSAYLRLLLLGAPKIGKTRTVIDTASAAFGEGYVINCDDQFSLKPAAVVTKKFQWDPVYSGDLFAAMEKAIKEARDGVRDGKYKWILWDTMTYYAQRIESAILDSTDTGKGPDGRRAYPEYEKRLRNIVDRLFTVKAHVIVNAHYIDVKGALIDNQLDKTGDGICPMLAGKARATIPAMFQDCVWMEKKGGRRVFTCSSDGVWGPGCRNLDGVSVLDADIGLLWKEMQSKSKSQNSATTKPKDKTK